MVGGRLCDVENGKGIGIPTPSSHYIYTPASNSVIELTLGDRITKAWLIPTDPIPVLPVSC